MTPVKNNVIQDLVTTLNKLERTMEQIKKIPAPTADSASLKQQCMDSLQDFDAELCRLVSVLTNSPLNGKLFVPLPQNFESTSTQETSVNFQLLPNNTAH